MPATSVALQSRPMVVDDVNEPQLKSAAKIMTNFKIRFDVTRHRRRGCAFTDHVHGYMHGFTYAYLEFLEATASYMIICSYCTMLIAYIEYIARA